MLNPPTPAEALTGTPFRGPNYQYSSGSAGVVTEPRPPRDIRLDHAPATQLVKNVIPEATGDALFSSPADIAHGMEAFTLALVSAARSRGCTCDLIDRVRPQG